ncbi:hypothetical protein TARUN_2185 [Trichoderma arundinaceum]|uniref:Uncharacterized protein n=1 Tax=Trichoderma arundinaceum TaxID=490622 RepID=A0A395NW94_TRIAR|nr:hypothetical protein TARUN_2185 [Trichoderma arundinaceum]
MPGLVGSNPSPRKYVEAAGKLTAEELSVVDANSASIPPIRQENQENFAIGADKTLTEDDESLELVKEMAKNAVAGASAIRLVFSEMDRKIQQIDAIHHSNFAPTLEGHRARFESLLENSQRFAIELSVYAEVYMNSFVSDFATWAKDKEEEHTQEIKGLEAEIEELIKKVAKLEKALIGLGISAAVVAALLPTTGPPGPFLLVKPPSVSSTFFFRLRCGYYWPRAITGLAVDLQKTKRKIEEKNKEIEDKNDQIKQIQEARIGLTELGEQQMEEFDENMLFIVNF